MTFLIALSRETYIRHWIWKRFNKTAGASEPKKEKEKQQNKNIGIRLIIAEILASFIIVIIWFWPLQLGPHQFFFFSRFVNTISFFFTIRILIHSHWFFLTIFIGCVFNFIVTKCWHFSLNTLIIIIIIKFIYIKCNLFCSTYFSLTIPSKEGKKKYK